MHDDTMGACANGQRPGPHMDVVDELTLDGWLWLLTRYKWSGSFWGTTNDDRAKACFDQGKPDLQRKTSEPSARPARSRRRPRPRAEQRLASRQTSASPTLTEHDALTWSGTLNEVCRHRCRTRARDPPTATRPCGALIPEPITPEGSVAVGWAREMVAVRA